MENNQGSGLKKRLPAKEKLISEIAQNDIRVRVLGTVIDRSEGSVVVDDGSGRLEIFLDGQPFESDAMSLGKMARIVTRVLPITGGFEARAECVQNMSGFDVELYRRAKDIAKNI